MAETGYKPVPHDAAFRKSLMAKPGVKKAFDALQKTADSDDVNLSGNALCPLCGQGSVTACIDQVESEYKGTKAMVPLHYTVCSACASDFADAEQGRLNKLAVLAFRKSVDDGCSFNAN
jgi:hypothetical protein